MLHGFQLFHPSMHPRKRLLMHVLVVSRTDAPLHLPLPDHSAPHVFSGGATGGGGGLNMGTAKGTCK